MDSFEQVNGIQNPDNVTVGELYYIPLNSVPGDPYPVENVSLPAPASAPSVDNSTEHRAALLILEEMPKILMARFVISFRSFGSQVSFMLQEGTSAAALGTNVFDPEKPVIFTYDEILYSTDGFSDASLLGHGTYGSVYYGVLHYQEVAIRRMTATKSKEFMAEMKILCKVHHTNLVELIGYAATDDELFLIYEYAQKGHTFLSWIMRVQIALDAARGLEYIHEHTITHYVHRDIKTSNILLDGAFRAKISDFGFTKLVGKTSDGEATTTKVVGTFGYLAQRKEAIIRTEGMVTKNHERRSLASVMLTVLRNAPDSMSMSSMKDYIDPNMMNLYPHDCLFKINITDF
ncbi:hypothetical protein Ddye_014475 [Dipteronia dyeriana]|uniref:non-specific serine/threonine protein kinase n=1 Tax=Dipteronia dyeriana TaxID=168575 RepID=A0AAD9X849_9ROSI|nr:hypothetical protein Ddye_014475 [Dipteronia dyeriana]